MAKQLYSTGANTALIKGARDLALATTMPVDTTAAQKAIGKSTERLQKYAMAKANERIKKIQATQKKIADRIDKFPVEDVKVPQKYREANDKWIQGQRGRYIQFVNQLEGVGRGSDEEYNIKRQMAGIITSIENNSDQWNKYNDAKNLDKEEYYGGDISNGNDPGDVDYLGNFTIDENEFAGNDDSGNILFFKGGDVQAWNDRPSVNIKSRKAAIALDNMATRIIRRGQKFDGTNEIEYRNDLIQLMEENPNAVYSLASDDLFGAFDTTQDAEGNIIKLEPIEGGYELAKEKGVGELQNKVLETYMGYLSQVANNAYNAKQKRDNKGIKDDPVATWKSQQNPQYIQMLEAASSGLNLNNQVYKFPDPIRGGVAQEFKTSYKPGDENINLVNKYGQAMSLPVKEFAQYFPFETKPGYESGQGPFIEPQDKPQF